MRRAAMSSRGAQQVPRAGGRGRAHHPLSRGQPICAVRFVSFPFLPFFYFIYVVSRAWLSVRVAALLGRRRKKGVRETHCPLFTPQGQRSSCAVKRSEPDSPNHRPRRGCAIVCGVAVTFRFVVFGARARAKKGPTTHTPRAHTLTQQAKIIRHERNAASLATSLCCGRDTRPAMRRCAVPRLARRVDRTRRRRAGV